MTPSDMWKYILEVFQEHIHLTKNKKALPEDEGERNICQS